MSAPITGAAGGGTAPAASGEPAGGTPSVVYPGTAKETPDPSTAGGDYKARVRAGGEFAVEENAKYQSLADKAEASRRKHEQWMGPLQQYQDRFTGEEIIGHLTDYNKVLSHPEMAQKVRAFLENGGVQTVEATDTTDEDEYLSDEQKEIRALKAQLATVDGRIASQESNAGAQALAKNLEGFYQKWPVPTDVAERVRSKLSGIISGWAKQGEVGRKALAELQGPKGAETVELLSLQVMSEAERDAAIDERRLRRQSGLAGLSTGGPSGGASMGNERPPVFKSSLEALQFAKNNPGSHGSF